MSKEEIVENKAAGTQQTPSYADSQIEKDAQLYGYKAANLIKLGHVVAKFNETAIGKRLNELSIKLTGSGIKAEVPKFILVGEKELYQHLDNYVPTWHYSWEEAKTSIKNQQVAGTLSAESEECFLKLQKIITNCFNAHEFPLESPGSPEIIEMARSSGRHEDRADMANPGGNESLPCDASNAGRSRAIGQVLASFFGAKSFNQRLANDPANESILELPGGGVVLQEMVGEGVNGYSQVYSGVAYTDGDTVKVQVAPGHGEYVVNSKAPCDTYNLGNNGIVRAEIVAKPFRDKPKISNIAGQKQVELEQVENDALLKYSPSLGNQLVPLYMQELFKYLEQEYGIRLDLEYIYSPAAIKSGKDHVINVVQGRAIPEGSQKGRIPSTISPEFLAKNKLQIINGLQVITLEIKSAAFITNMNQLVLADNCDQAESKYNAISDKSAIKAIIVQNREEALSHASGFFLGQGLVVMQVKDTSRVEKLLRGNSTLPLIADPQHSKIYQLPPEYANVTEKQLFEQEVLVKGIYGSSASNYITALKYDFSEAGRVQITPLSTDSMLDINVGQVILDSLTGSSESFEKLLSIVATAFEYRKDDDISISDDKALILRDNINKLTTFQIGQENGECRQKLGYTLRTILESNEKKIINPDLGKQAMIIGSELYLLLNKIETLEPDKLSEIQKNKIYIEYFDVLKKFEGLIIGGGNSLAQILEANKYREIAKKLNPHLTEEAKEHLIDNLRLGDYLLNRDFHEKETTKKWNEFCARICSSQDPSMAKILSTFTAKLVSYDAHEQWLKFIFVEVNDPKDPQKTLAKLINDLNEIDLTKIQQAVKAINSLEKQISQWAEPKNFEGLYENPQYMT
ncbi:PEP/pyruvate-binding domain-containing protein [Candidatus Tisiphia endosymbiont of Beris chalybata]|uniref:PEP/pyruvate-binding domain-containing protein n=1 Tax=Candidatus Tisiphia endosymbiont of Beris chalybata TaxID=3066262 RepID=UPI00312C7E7F